MALTRAPNSAANRRCVIICTLVAFLTPLIGCRETNDPPRAAAAPTNSVESLIKEVGLTSNPVGMIAVKLASGEVVASWNETQLLIPASTLKLLTTYGALLRHGPEYRFATRVFAGGRENAHANQLVLEGSGDPFLADGTWNQERPQAWRDLADQVWQAGVRRVDGPLVADGSRFGPSLVPFDWGWGDLDREYAAPVSSLSAGHNVFLIHSRPGSADSSARLEVRPPLDFLRRDIDNEVRTVKEGLPSLRLRRQRHNGRILVSGEASLARGGLTVRCSVHDPAAYAGHWFAAELRQRGIQIADGVVSTYRARDRVDEEQVASIESEPLAQIVRRINRDSDNLGAENILRSLVDGASSSAEAGKELLRLLTSSGFPTQPPPRLVDGSGLSRTNLLTPEQLVWVLVDARQRRFAEEFAGSLSRAGDNGRLDGHPVSKAMPGRVLAKTGSFRGTHCLAGYLLDAEGQPETAFAIMINGLSQGYQPALDFETRILELLGSDPTASE